MNARTNLREQLRRLDLLFAGFQVLDHLERQGKLLIHHIDPESQMPQMAFVDDADWPLAQKLFGDVWASIASRADEVTFATVVHGVCITCRVQVRNENLCAEVAG